ncbi:hypothetical protein P43SY_007632 [Pythium insidiosum]|uniref:Uncharacterized protein n=1 Tax=Pythium insidiosum TaxID=114742 RepID=A0AAD5LZN3_PYTIN|nr:hypothetical protein P43SY_007632 [Pythium insidiosum]
MQRALEKLPGIERVKVSTSPATAFTWEITFLSPSCDVPVLTPGDVSQLQPQSSQSDAPIAARNAAFEVRSGVLIQIQRVTRGQGQGSLHDVVVGGTHVDPVYRVQPRPNINPKATFQLALRPAHESAGPLTRDLMLDAVPSTDDEGIARNAGSRLGASVQSRLQEALGSLVSTYADKGVSASWQKAIGEGLTGLGAFIAVRTLWDSSGLGRFHLPMLMDDKWQNESSWISGVKLTLLADSFLVKAPVNITSWEEPEFVIIEDETTPIPGVSVSSSDANARLLLQITAQLGSISVHNYEEGPVIIFQAARDDIGVELFLTDGTASGTALVEDIWRGPRSSSPGPFVEWVSASSQGAMYFAATNDLGRELWATTGAAFSGTALVRDICVGAASSAPQFLTPMGVMGVFFSATDCVNGRELWVTDGSPAGTKMVLDLNVAPGVGSSPSWLVAFRGKLYFSAIRDSSTGHELFVSDGRQQLYFFAATGGPNTTNLWKTDGTPANTQPVWDEIFALSHDVAVIPVQIREVNDAPFLVVSEVVFVAREDEALVLTGLELRDPDVSDMERVTVDIQVGVGSIKSLYQGLDLRVTSDDAKRSLRLQGRLSALNAALSSLAYTLSALNAALSSLAYTSAQDWNSLSSDQEYDRITFRMQDEQAFNSSSTTSCFVFVEPAPDLVVIIPPQLTSTTVYKEIPPLTLVGREDEWIETRDCGFTSVDDTARTTLEVELRSQHGWLELGSAASPWLLEGVTLEYDATSDTEIEVVLETSRGQLRLPVLQDTVGSLAFSSPSSYLLLTGTVDELNAALSEIVWEMELPNSASVSLTKQPLEIWLTADDQGASGLGGPIVSRAAIRLEPSASLMRWVPPQLSIEAPATQLTTPEDVPLSLDNELRVNDTDEARMKGSLYELRIVSHHGDVQLQASVGLQVERTTGRLSQAEEITIDDGDSGQMAHPRAVHLTGFLSQLNAALRTASFVPDRNWFGTEELHINAIVDPLGASEVTSASLFIAVVPVCDEPLWRHTESVLEMNEDEDVLVSSLSLVDPDLSDGRRVVSVTVDVLPWQEASSRVGGVMLATARGLELTETTFMSPTELSQVIAIAHASQESTITRSRLFFSHVRLTGRVEDINAALQGLIFRPASDAHTNGNVVDAIRLTVSALPACTSSNQSPPTQVILRSRVQPAPDALELLPTSLVSRLSRWGDELGAVPPTAEATEATAQPLPPLEILDVDADALDGPPPLTTDGYETEPSVYFDQCGWSGFRWGGVPRMAFRFADSRVTGAFKHAGHRDSFRPDVGFQTDDFAGIVCRKSEVAPTGRELWKTDGTPHGTTRVSALSTPSASFDPQFLVEFQSRLYFQATTDSYGAELWRSDGTEAGTQLVADVALGVAGSRPEFLTVANSLLFFAAETPGFGRELWVSDGAVREDYEQVRRDTPGTRLVLDIRAGDQSSSPRYLVELPSAGLLLFQADDGIHGEELWASDGSASNTRIVADICSGPQGSAPSFLTHFAGRIYFQANDGVSGTELWASDGSTLNTRRLVDIAPGASSSSPRHLSVLSLVLAPSSAAVNTLVFAAQSDADMATEWWRSDGTLAGTSRLFAGSREPLKLLSDGVRQRAPVVSIRPDSLLYFEEETTSLPQSRKITAQLSRSFSLVDDRSSGVYTLTLSVTQGGLSLSSRGCSALNQSVEVATASATIQLRATMAELNCWVTEVVYHASTSGRPKNRDSVWVMIDVVVSEELQDSGMDDGRAYSATAQLPIRVTDDDVSEDEDDAIFHVWLAVRVGVLRFPSLQQLTSTREVILLSDASGEDGGTLRTIDFAAAIGHINALLSGLEYACFDCSDVDGVDELTIVVDDNGNSGTGGPQATTGVMQIQLG